MVGGEPSLANPQTMLVVETILSADNTIWGFTCAEPIDDAAYLLRVSARLPTEPMLNDVFR